MEQRKKKFLNIGKQKSFTVFSQANKWVEKNNFLINTKEFLFKFKKELLIAFLLILVGIIFFT